MDWGAPRRLAGIGCSRRGPIGVCGGDPRMARNDVLRSSHEPDQGEMPIYDIVPDSDEVLDADVVEMELEP